MIDKIEWSCYRCKRKDTLPLGEGFGWTVVSLTMQARPSDATTPFGTIRTAGNKIGQEFCCPDCSDYVWGLFFK